MKTKQNACLSSTGLSLAGTLALAISTGCQPPPVMQRPSSNVTPAATSTQPVKPAAPIETPTTVTEKPVEPEPAKPAVTEEPAKPDEPAKKPDEPAVKPDAPENGAKAAADKAKALVGPGDWNQWGGSPARNNVADGKNIPREWAIGSFDRKTQAWIKEGSKNIKWVSDLGSQTYGNPVVANGKIWVGTNNGRGWLKRYAAEVDLGCLLCFRESDGKFLWQHSSEKLPTGRVHDWPQQGICCAPLIEGDRLWFVTSRGEVVCADADGFHDDEDDGEKAGLIKMFEMGKNDEAIADLKEGKLSPPVREAFTSACIELPEAVVPKAEGENKWTFAATVGGVERQFQVTVRGPNMFGWKQLTVDDKDEADVIWSYDMMAKMGVSQHNMCSCSITGLGDTLFICTANGVDEDHRNVPAPDAPSFFAMNKNTGEVHWTDKSPGLNILHGQWSSPCVAEFAGVPQVVFAGGDGWLYSFRADEGKDGKPELLWKFDANPKESKYILGGRGTRNEIIATPVAYKGAIYLAVGQDPEHGEGIGHLWCIDPTKRGDISPELAVKREKPDELIPQDSHHRLQAVIAEEGEVAIPNPNSGVKWHYSENDLNGDGKIDFDETMHRTIGTVVIKNDLLFLADFSGLFHCVDAITGHPYWTHDLLAATWGSALIVGDHVYVGDEDGDLTVFKVSKEKHEPVFEINMDSSVYSTPVVANNVLYISTKNKLFAIAPTE